MAYARFSPDSEVYVYPSVVDGAECFVCCVCELQPDDELDHRTDDADGMLRHLRDHIAHGQAVPARALERLERVAVIGWRDEELEQMAREELARAKYVDQATTVLGVTPGAFGRFLRARRRR